MAAQRRETDRSGSGQCSVGELVHDEHASIVGIDAQTFSAAARASEVVGISAMSAGDEHVLTAVPLAQSLLTGAQRGIPGISLQAECSRPNSLHASP